MPACSGPAGQRKLAAGTDQQQAVVEPTAVNVLAAAGNASVAFAPLEERVPALKVGARWWF